MDPIRILTILIINYIVADFYGISAAVISNYPAIRSKSLVPTDKSDEQYAAEMTDFWTVERLNAAIPKPLVNVDLLPSNARTIIEENEQSATPTLIEGTTPTSASATPRTAGFPITVGKVYFVDGAYSYSCSASVVTSNSKDMIFTAGHCIYSITSYTFVSNFIFIPQYENNTRPYGTWVARSLYAMSNWANYLDLNSDVAIVLLYTLNGQHIQDVVGSQSVGFSYSHSGPISSFGYPSNYINGQVITSCSSTKYFANYSTYTGDALPCGMNQGCSGGPWFDSYNSFTFTGIQTSVNSFTRNATSNIMYGPYFGSSVRSMYDYVNGVSTSTISSSAARFFSTDLKICFALITCFSLFSFQF